MSYSWDDGSSDQPASSGYSWSTGQSSAASSGGYSWSTGSAKKRKAPDPIKRLRGEVTTITDAAQGLTGADKERAKRLLAQVSQGLGTGQAVDWNDPAAAWAAASAASQSPSGLGGAPEGEIPLRPGVVRPGVTTGLTNPVSLGGAILREVSRPVQAVTSGVGELGNEVHAGGRLNLPGPDWLSGIPTFNKVDLGKIGSAAGQGFEHKRADTPSSIISGWAKIDRAQGRGGPATVADTAFKHVPGAKFVADMTLGALLDPLTYVTLGTSSLVKRALEVTADTLGAERAAQVARSGLGALDDTEHAALSQRLSREGMEALDRGAQGGIGVRVPFGNETGRTIIPTRPAFDAAKALGRSAEESTVLGPLARGARTFGRAVERQFVPRAPLIDEIGADAARQLHDADVARHAAPRAASEADVARMTVGTRAAGASTEDLKGQVGPALDIGNVPADPRLARAMSSIAGVRADLEQAQVAAGLLQDPAAREAQLALDALDKAGKASFPHGRAADERALGAQRVAGIDVARTEKGLPNAIDEVATRSRQLTEVRGRIESAEQAMSDAAKAGDFATYQMRRADLVAATHDAQIAAGDVSRVGAAGAALDVAQGRAGVAAERAALAGERIGDRAIAAQRLVGEGDELAGAMERVNKGVIGSHEYVPHVTTPEGLAFLKKQPTLSGRVGKAISSKDPFVQERVLRGMSAREINDELTAELRAEAVSRGMTATEAADKVKRLEFFDENPVSAFARRSVAARTAIANKEFLGKVLKINGPDGAPIVRLYNDLPEAVDRGPLSTLLKGGKTVPGDEAIPRAVPAGWKELDLPIGPAGAPVKAVAPVPVADILQATSQALADPAEFWRMWDGVENWWKTMATVPLPFGFGFHIRNATSNVMLNWLSGVGVEVGDYRRALNLQRLMSKGLKVHGDPLALLQGADRELAAASLERDIQSTGVLGALDQMPKEVGTGRAVKFGAKTGREKASQLGHAANILSSKGAPAKIGRAFGEGIEENARLAHFIAAQRKLGDWDAAGRSARRWLFDYRDVTGTEQWLKRFMPFYSWTRKSLSAVAEAVLRDPRKLSQFERARQSIASTYGADLSHTLVPQYTREGTGVIVRNPLDPNAPLSVDPDTPFTTPFETLNAGYSLAQALPGVRDVAPPLGTEGPWGGVQTLAGMVGGPAGVAKAMLESLLGKSSFSGAPIRNEDVVAPTPLNLIPLLTRRRTINGKKQASITSAERNILQAAVPFISKVEGLIPNDPADQEKQIRRLISTITGLQVQPIGPKTQASEAYRRQELVDRFKADMKAKGAPGF